ncbi:hypothetical protein QJS04_geneDACA016076 [Acorus gramineus]|uniref:Uncharacterized protein n=1 Tax=Acorus gramineus TaxID=55184 RepID=A0AAV9BDZ7_ACOGR|nr:hypothetical protein QJS04_geneDACA016076 [Acorus gramineus]
MSSFTFELSMREYNLSDDGDHCWNHVHWGPADRRDRSTLIIVIYYCRRRFSRRGGGGGGIAVLPNGVAHHHPLP